MTVTSIYLKDAAAGVFRALQVGGSVPATTTTSTGWVVGTVSPTAYSQMASNTERASSTFSSTAQPPDSGPDSTLGDGFRTENVVNGYWAAGTWTIPIPVIRVTAGTTADGRVRVRLWRSPNADGSAATEVTSGVQTGTTVTNLTNVEQISTVTATVNEFGCVDEYLFLSVAWEITGAGGGATDDVDIRVGTSGTITPPDFTTATNTEYEIVLAGRGLVVKKGDYLRSLAQQFATQLSTTGAQVKLGEDTRVMTGYGGGSGYSAFDTANPTRYYQGYGVDVTTTKDKAQVGPAVNQSASVAINAWQYFGTYNSELYVGSSAGNVYRSTALDTWSSVGTITSSRAVSAIAEATGDVSGITARMWVANSVNALLATWNGTTFTNSAADCNVGATAPLSIVYALLPWIVPTSDLTLTFCIGGKIASLTQCAFGLAANTSFSGGGNWLDLTSAVNFSDAGYSSITAAVVGSDNCLYWCAADTSGVKGQLIKSSASSASAQAQFRGAQATVAYLADDYLTSIVELNGVMYGLGAAGRLYTIESDHVNVIASGLSPSTATLYGLTSWRNALWVSCRSGTSLLVRRYGQSDPNDASSTLVWSEPIYGGTIDATSTAARASTSFGGYLYQATEISGAAKVYRMASTTYTTSAVTLQTGEITFDSGVIVKSIKVEHAALVSGDSIQLKYARNGGSTFYSLGTNSTVGSTSTSYAVAASGQITRLSVQALITSGSSSTTPQLGQLTIVVRPIGDVTREWTITMHHYGNSTWSQARRDGQVDPHTGQQVIDSLWRVFEEGTTQRMRDIDNTIYTVTVESWDDHPQEQLAHTAGLRWNGTLRVREV